jgi:hypothetical protein
MEDLDARLRLANLLSVCENEIQALDDLRDPRLKGVLQAMATLRAEIVAATVALTNAAGGEKPG